MSGPMIDMDKLLQAAVVIDQEHKKIAHKLATYPTLVEALEDCVSALRMIRDNGPGLIAQHGDALEALLAAIALATGDPS